MATTCREKELLKCLRATEENCLGSKININIIMLGDLQCVCVCVCVHACMHTAQNIYYLSIPVMIFTIQGEYTIDPHQSSMGYKVGGYH